MRIPRPLGLIGTLVCASAAAASLPAAASAAINISPAQECLTFNATSQTVNYRLAGVNADGADETLSVGDNNLFSPIPADRGQPVQFVPGLTQWNLSRRSARPA